MLRDAPDGYIPQFQVNEDDDQNLEENGSDESQGCDPDEPDQIPFSIWSWLPGPVWGFSVIKASVSFVSAIAVSVTSHWLDYLFNYVTSSSKAGSISQYKFLMRAATCYEQWAAAGYMLDRNEGGVQLTKARINGKTKRQVHITTTVLLEIDSRHSRNHESRAILNQ